MTYEAYVLSVFEEDQSAYGVGMDEISDLIEETPFEQIERFLAKRYDLRDMYAIDCE